MPVSRQLNAVIPFQVTSTVGQRCSAVDLLNYNERQAVALAGGVVKRLVYDLRINHRAGMFRYARSILARLGPMVENSGAHLYVVHSLDRGDSAYEDLRARLPASSVEFISVPDDAGFTRTSPWLRRWLVRQRIDLYYTVNYLVDRQLPVPYIHTVHDLIRLRHPDLSYTDASFRARYGEREFACIRSALEALRHFVPSEQRSLQNSEIFPSYFWAVNRFQVEHSARVVTVSETSRKDIVRMLDAPPEKVAVVPNAVDTELFYPRVRSEVDEVRERFGVPWHYCLYVGLAHPHKRVPWLLQVWSETLSRLPPDAMLVLICSNPRARGQLKSIIRQLSLNGRVLLLDPVSDNELACLYSRAQAVVVPSIFEGFCLPALEGLACGTEVIAPDIETLWETVGDNGHFYNVNSAEELADNLVTAFTGRMEKKAVTYRSRYSWESSAARLFETIQTAW